ncbi:MAG: chemotaxis protein CheA [Vulcanimicrobiaceae bacterium]
MIGIPGDRGELIRYFRDECDELIAQIDGDLLELEALAAEGRSDAERINSLFRALHTIKGSAGMLQMNDVASLAHKLENACDVLRTGRGTLSKSLIEVLFDGRDLLTALIRCGIEETAPPPSGVAEELSARVEAALANPQAENVSAPPAPSTEPVSTARGRGRTIRVDIVRLDDLVDLVGELVIAKNRIVQIAATLGDERGTELSDAATRLARTTAELQESIMQARMVRIAGVFERFPRLVRDLAKAGGKDIDLIIEGEDTNLDKTLVDELGEPLMHLVRNCVDHGIESPRRRRESGKPMTATLRLQARREGNSVVVRVEDDGAGIDLPRVKERAVELGLLGAHDRPDEHGLLEMLFVPGFSTARTITEVSGRGIGMDVVRRSITRLSGTLEVETKSGQGTAFTIRLPLTLAILRALLVKIGGELYALPVDGVTESLRLDPADVGRKPDGEVIEHRGSQLPILRGAEFFEVGALRSATEKVLIVVLSAGNRQVGLVVDEFVGEEEIVVKPLSDLVGAIPGIFGGTILGDGAIALIIDPVALVSQVHRRAGPLLVSPSMG